MFYSERRLPPFYWWGGLPLLYLIIFLFLTLLRISEQLVGTPVYRLPSRRQNCSVQLQHVCSLRSFSARWQSKSLFPRIVTATRDQETIETSLDIAYFNVCSASLQRHSCNECSRA
jgi:hypothetical protein